MMEFSLENESFLETTSMFCFRGKSIGLTVIQQNEKSTQIFKRKLWIRGLAAIGVMGEMCIKGLQLQKPWGVHFEVYQ